ncbi:TonB-dependent receptor [Niveispirillum cyanobacteriorum]|uniref:Ligand-gated channel protein n=2 Tax=Niveispirillum TaxID=1543704 RepID=A0A255Z6M3_9PROT|nr:TonB-dependent receptor [Niveispirillum cyanobacteriorum]OYQ37071.1 ligand-gated channel protein [Niveispirillum lacus]GGE87963.1 TonB-dependent receptor [Niveispirillum cyanobacteriorum]
MRKLMALPAAFALCTSVYAQNSGPGSSEGEGLIEIIVTAQKRAQGLQEVPASVTALGEEALASIGRQDVTALAGQVPSLQVNQYSPTITIFNLRGVSQNDFADSQEAPIAFYSDEVYVSALGAISGQTFDLERVEVLRGPQGTLFGRNATGGLIQIVSAKPTDRFEGFLTSTVGSHSQIATEGAVSGPLSDRVRGRLAFTTNHHKGYIENRIGPDLGNSKFYGIRPQLAVDVGEDGELTLKVQHLRNDHERSGGLYSHIAARPDANGLGMAVGPQEDYYGTGPGADPIGFREPDSDPFTASNDRIGSFDRKFSSVTARYTQTVGAVDLTSITDYQELRKSYGEDTDMSPDGIFNFDTHQKLKQFSQELRLAQDTDRYNWLAGAYYLSIRSDNAYAITSPLSILPRQNYGGTLKTDNWSGFGQFEYNLTDTVSAVVGGRYSSDAKKYDFAHRTDGIGDFIFNQTTNPSLARRTFHDWSGRLELNYKPTRDMLFYGGVNRGTKSGGFGTQAFTPIDPATIPFGSEKLTSYEMGAKLTLDRTTKFNTAVFHYDYKDYQAFSIVALSQFIRNNPARVTGAEFELVKQPVKGLTLQLFGTYLDTKVKDIVLPSGTVADRELPQAPELSLGWMVRYEFALGAGSLAVQTDWKYDGAQFFSTFNAPIDHEGARVVGNARIAYMFDDGTEAAIFANNILDRRYRIYNLDLSGPLGISNQAYARPRWIGASLTVRFD